MRENIALVGHLVRELMGRLPAHVQRDDLTSAGLAALAGAARSWNAERGVPFARFASVRVRGALLDELRGLDWASRSVRSQARKHDAVVTELTASLGRTPTPTERAEAMGIAVAELDSHTEDVARSVVLSLHGMTDNSAAEQLPDSGATPEELLLHRERLGYLDSAIAVLPDRLQNVVQRYFIDEAPMATIATELGVSESRVSQLRSEALAMLRDGMNSALDPDLLDRSARTEGCVSRRRESYFAAVSAHGDLRSRLAATTSQGVAAPRRGIA